MNVARPALAALLVGLALLGSPVLLLEFQEPAECANAVEPATTAGDVDVEPPERQYESLSSDAKDAFDEAQAAAYSVIVYGEDCPSEFEYGATQHHYAITKNDTRYILTTYANDLIPEVSIAAGLLAFLGLAILGVGLATRDNDDARFPVWTAGVGGVTFIIVTAAVVLDSQVWLAMGWTSLMTALTLIGAGAALPPRRALVFGGAIAILPALVAIPLAGVSPLFLAPALLPLLLVALGIASRHLIATIPHQ